MAPRDRCRRTALTRLLGRQQEGTVDLAFGVEVYARVDRRVFALDLVGVVAHGTDALEFDGLDCAERGGVARQIGQLLTRGPLHLLRQQLVVRHSSGEAFDELAQRRLGPPRRRLAGAEALPI